jgi:hypothetical protein
MTRLLFHFRSLLAVEHLLGGTFSAANATLRRKISSQPVPPLAAKAALKSGISYCLVFG